MKRTIYFILFSILFSFTFGQSYFYETSLKRTCEVYGPNMTSVRNCNDIESFCVFEVDGNYGYLKIHDRNGDIYHFQIYNVSLGDDIYFKTRDVTDNRLYQFLFTSKNTITMFSDDYPNIAILYFYKSSWIK